MKAKDLYVGQIVFFKRTESCWNKPFVKKRHHTYQTKSIILRGEVLEVKGEQFKAKLFGNNNFEKDGREFVFHQNTLLSNQNYTSLDDLGKWSECS